MVKDLKEKIILEYLKDRSEKDKEIIERLPFRLIKDGNWNKDIFNEEWFIKYKDFWGLSDELKEYIKDFDNVPNNKTKLCVFITPYMLYLGDKYGVPEASKRLF